MTTAIPISIPTIKRRMASMLYESLLLFGVIFIADALFDVATQSRHALKLRDLRQLWLFLVIGVYFLFFWCRSGQTLAMKTWRIRLVGINGAPPRPGAAAVRYLFAWMWFLPGMAVDYIFSLRGWPSIAVLAVGMIVWLCTALLDGERQFLHDRLARTRLTDAPLAPLAPV